MSDNNVSQRKGRNLGRIEDDMHSALVMTRDHYGTTSIKYIERRMLADPVFRANLKRVQAQKGKLNDQDTNN